MNRHFLSLPEFDKIPILGWFMWVLLLLGCMLLMQFAGLWALSSILGIEFQQIQSQPELIQNARPEWVLLALFAGFVPIIAVGYLLWKPWSGLSTRALNTADRPFRYGVFFAALVLVLGLIGAADFLYVLGGGNIKWQGDWPAFLRFLPWALLLFPFQTLFEEWVFRGFLMRGMHQIIRSPLAALLASSLFFGLLHMGNSEVSEFGVGYMLVYYMAQALVMGALVLLFDGLELAWAYHLANNLYVSLLVTLPGSSLRTPALWISEPPEPLKMLLLSSSISLIVALSLILIFRATQLDRLWKTDSGTEQK
jgi:membrane protease YdiL (CAAX protease family)